MAASDADAALMTMTGQFVGSLPWASPEQAEGSPSKIDIRTDVYSLGVILYRILTGQFPYQVIGNMRDVLDRILRAEPVRPSVAAGGRSARAEARGSSSRFAFVASWLRRWVASPINDEVETIVLKCLQNERERRYQSAGELARDIRHYLTGEPIEAKRDSGWYVLKKAVRRYKGPVAAACTLLLTLTGGLVVSWTLYARAVQTRPSARNRLCPSPSGWRAGGKPAAGTSAACTSSRTCASAASCPVRIPTCPTS